jgi:hypothetical protein
LNDTRTSRRQSVSIDEDILTSVSFDSQAVLFVSGYPVADPGLR